MARCGYCETTILFGGVRDLHDRYCNEGCRNAGALLAVSSQVPVDTVRQQVWGVHRGPCPKCKGRGPVDVHVSYWVWSAVLFTRWGSTPAVSCRACARKSQLANIASSLLLGWWGFPWGLGITPVQIFRNAVGLARGPDDAQPSPHLEKLVRLSIVKQSGANPA